MQASIRVIAAHLNSLLADWVLLADLCFIARIVADASLGGACQWQAPLRDALIGGAIWAFLMWWPERKRALAGQPPNPRAWWLPHRS